MKHDESNPTSDYGLKLDESMFFKFVTENVYAVCGHAQSMLTDGAFRCRTAFNCTTACPRGIKVTKAIEDVKRETLTIN